ncbi:hypothetical protein D9619_000713 [Psilocybe cf. subviscida]|uniref:F-box domain-containing protein n=1 Tax=Psilocybe cf. subviscida TaxID=2480587 RepID=A0A8H5F2F2_9AGAR|nr:hypothetical protein D9619_000713 [Psilocybe cf. subviscida]
MDSVTPISPATNGAEIPLDVLEVIFTSLMPYELAVCCRVSRAVHALAFEALYRDLRPNRRNVMALSLKLSSEPHLARRVRSFILHDTGVDMYLGVISDALARLPRLSVLVLDIGPLSSWILPKGAPCPFSLHTFASGFLYDNSLAAFLETQKNLRHLTVSSPNPPHILHSVSARLLPNLVSLCAPLSVAEVFVPGRRIRDLTTSCIPHPDAPLLSSLTESRAPKGIERLMLNYSYLKFVGCDALAEALPGLSNLFIDADTIRPDDEESLNELIEWIEEYLSYTKDLEYLNVRFFPMLSATPCQELDFSTMITSIFSRSTSLLFVIISFYSLKAKYVCKRIAGQDWCIVNG